MSGLPLTLFGGAVLAAAAWIVVVAVRHPELRRLAARSAWRRRGEASLAILGALLGTALITGSFLVGDSLRGSLRSGAFTSLGPIDETVTAPGAESLPLLREALADLPDHAAVDGILFGLQSRGTVAVRLDEPGAAVEPDVLLVEVDFDRAREFGADPDVTGLRNVPAPDEGEAVISSALAEAAEARVGDLVTIFAYGERRDLRVIAAPPAQGLAGYGIQPGSSNRTAFLAPGTLESMSAAGNEQGARPPTALAFVSNVGGVLSGAERTEQVMELLDDRTAGVPRAGLGDSKRQLLERAEATGEWFTELFLGIGAFAIAAGILLLVNVFVMIAQERMGQLGIMRAIGMRRSTLVQAFLVEGAIYASAASLLGAIVGVGVGAAIMRLSRAISEGPAGFTLDLRFVAEPSSILAGFLIGAATSLLTILITSMRISRLNIVAAIREMPRAPKGGRRWPRVAWGSALTLAGVGITVATVVGGTNGGVAMLLGPALAALGLQPLARAYLPSRAVGTGLSLLVLAWVLAAPTVAVGAFRGASVAPFVVQGLIAIGAAAALLAQNQAAVGRAIRRVLGTTGSVVTRLGLGYPLAQPFRTMMTLTMYALVFFMLVSVSLFIAVFGRQVGAFTEAESGGYDLVAESTLTSSLPPEEVRAFGGVAAVAPLRHVGFNAEFRVATASDFEPWFATGFDRALLEVAPPPMARWLPELGSERDAWQHVLGNPSTMIVDSRFLEEGENAQAVALGDVVEVRNPFTGSRAERTVAAVLEGGLTFNGALMSVDSLTSIFGGTVPVNRLYVALADDADATRVANELERQYLERGAQVRTFREIVAARQRNNVRFLRILQAYLVLGLLIGTAGLGVVMVRAVRERTVQIGVLRSLGLQPSTVGRSFMLEAVFVTLQGIVIGAALAILTNYQLIENAGVLGGLDVSFTVPWAEMALLMGVTLLAAVAAAGWPAHRASRITPATALRREH